MPAQRDGRLRSCIDIYHPYAPATRSQDRCRVVFSTADNDLAMVLLNAAAA